MKKANILSDQSKVFDLSFDNMSYEVSKDWLTEARLLVSRRWTAIFSRP